MKIFGKFDADGNSEVTYDEAQAVLKGLSFTDSQIQDLFLIHDVNKDGRLQYEEFVQFWGACGGKLLKDGL